MHANAVELVERWIAAWTHVRGIEMTQLDGWPLVHTRSRTRETELICWDPGPGPFSALMRHIAGDPRAMLTVIAEDVGPYATLDLPPGVRVDRDDETLMTVELVTAPAVHPNAFTSRWEIVGNAVTLRLETADELAAEGTVGVLDGVATFDAVETTPAFQRRGLGRCVMSMLSSYAIDHGAELGVLAASASGRGLYESLGWEVALELRSLMGA